MRDGHIIIALLLGALQLGFLATCIKHAVSCVAVGRAGRSGRDTLYGTRAAETVPTFPFSCFKRRLSLKKSI